MAFGEYLDTIIAFFHSIAAGVPAFIHSIGTNVPALCAALFVCPFMQEDLSVITGGILVINHMLPWELAAPILFAGVVGSDLSIYGLGRIAGRNQWIRQRIETPSIKRATERLHKHLIPTVALCRTVPGFVFPTFLACGMTRVPFPLFATTTITAALIYVAALLGITVKLGEKFAGTFGHKIWIIPLVLIAFIFVMKVIPLIYSLIRGPRNGTALDRLPKVPDNVGHSNPFEPHPARICPSEKIPPLLFYVPIVLDYLRLSLKYRSFTLQTAANPNIEAGGMWGESKSRLMWQISDELQKWVSPFVTLERTGDADCDTRLALDFMAAAQLGFPIVAKPDIGWQGYGVRRLEDDSALRIYVEQYPKDLTIILQKQAPWMLEAGVFYVRMPDEPKGRITSLTFRTIPSVIGDGKSTVLELIGKDARTKFKSGLYTGADGRHKGLSKERLKSIPAEGERVHISFIGSLRTGGEYRDGRRHITEALSQRFDEIASSMPDFHFGRFDIRFSSIAALERGEDFTIFEINGAGAEAIHIWDPDLPVSGAYRELFAYQKLLFEIAAANRERGIKPVGLLEFISFTSGYNRLVHSYPPSE